MKYRPVPILKVVADTPAFPHGETAESPSPVASASSTSVRAQEATAPARTAAQETPETDGSTRPATGAGVVDWIICCAPSGDHDRLTNELPEQRFLRSEKLQEVCAHRAPGRKWKFGCCRSGQRHGTKYYSGTYASCRASRRRRSQ